MNLSVMGAMRSIFHESGAILRRHDWQESFPDPGDPEWLNYNSEFMRTKIREIISAVLSDIENMLTVQTDPSTHVQQCYRPELAYGCGIMEQGVLASVRVVLRTDGSRIVAVNVVALGIDCTRNAVDATLYTVLGMLPHGLLHGRIIQTADGPMPCTYDRLEHLYFENLFGRAPSGTQTHPGAGASLDGLLAALPTLHHLRTVGFNGLGVYDGSQRERTIIPGRSPALTLLSGTVFSPHAPLSVLMLCDAGLIASHIGALRTTASNGPWLPHLTALSLAYNGEIGDEGALLLMDRLRSRPPGQYLDFLSLQGCGVAGKDNTAAALLRAVTELRLGALDVSCNRLTAPFWRALGQFNFMHNVGHLHTLDVSYTNMNTQSLQGMFPTNINTRTTLGRLHQIACGNAQFHDMNRLAAIAEQLLAGGQEGKQRMNMFAEPGFKKDLQKKSADTAMAVSGAAFKKMKEGHICWVQTRKLHQVCYAVGLLSNFTRTEQHLILMETIAQMMVGANTAVSLCTPKWVHIRDRGQTTFRARYIQSVFSAGVVTMWGGSRAPMVLRLIAPTESLLTYFMHPALANGGIDTGSNIVVAHAPLGEVLPFVMTMPRLMFDILCRSSDLPTIARGPAVRIFCDQRLPSAQDLRPPPPPPALAPVEEEVRQPPSSLPPMSTLFHPPPPLPPRNPSKAMEEEERFELLMEWLDETNSANTAGPSRSVAALAMPLSAGPSPITPAGIISGGERPPIARRAAGEGAERPVSIQRGAVRSSIPIQPRVPPVQETEPSPSPPEAAQPPRPSRKRVNLILDVGEEEEEEEEKEKEKEEAMATLVQRPRSVPEPERDQPIPPTPTEAMSAVYVSRKRRHTAPEMSPDVIPSSVGSPEESPKVPTLSALVPHRLPPALVRFSIGPVSGGESSSKASSCAIVIENIEDVDKIMQCDDEDLFDEDEEKEKKGIEAQRETPQEALAHVREGLGHVLSQPQPSAAVDYQPAEYLTMDPNAAALDQPPAPQSQLQQSQPGDLFVAFNPSPSERSRYDDIFAEMANELASTLR